MRTSLLLQKPHLLQWSIFITNKQTVQYTERFKVKHFQEYPVFILDFRTYGHRQLGTLPSPWWCPNKPDVQASLTHVPGAMFWLRQDIGVLVVMLNTYSHASASQGDGKDLQPEGSRAEDIAMASHLSWKVTAEGWMVGRNSIEKSEKEV